jgi:hypothetical protein
MATPHSSKESAESVAANCLVTLRHMMGIVVQASATALHACCLRELVAGVTGVGTGACVPLPSPSPYLVERGGG